jgi:hypothetical protein
MIDFIDWPPWGGPFAWTLVTLAASWTFGRVFASIVIRYLARGRILAPHT